MGETRKIAAILCSDVVGYSRLAGALDHAAVMYGDCRVDEVAAQRPQPR
jgi:class 3 adenylate cyclase